METKHRKLLDLSELLQSDLEKKSEAYLIAETQLTSLNEESKKLDQLKTDLACVLQDKVLLEEKLHRHQKALRTLQMVSKCFFIAFSLSSLCSSLVSLPFRSVKSRRRSLFHLASWQTVLKPQLLPWSAWTRALGTDGRVRATRQLPWITDLRSPFCWTTARKSTKLIFKLALTMIRLNWRIFWQRLHLAWQVLFWTSWTDHPGRKILA